MELVTQEFSVADKIFRLKRIANLDALVDQVSDEQFNEDERLPYWAELWPSAIGLSRFLVKNVNLIEQKTILELGSGLGLTSLTIATLNSKSFLATDYEQDALNMIKENFLLNGLALPEFKLLDWRNPDLKTSYDVIIASDILYEDRFFNPLLQLFNRFLTKGGNIIIAEPNRPIARHFFVKLLKSGFRDKTSDEMVKQDNHAIKITIHQLIKE